ncbi:MAG TPA: sigma-54-dependent Fis family transcriptional regulator [Rhodocyclaceae bacterium]
MRAKFQRGWLPRPENDGRIKSAWERFLSGDAQASTALRQMVDDSWQRCLGDKVDPHRDQAQSLLDEDRLAQLRDKHQRLLSISAPLMAKARDFLSQTGTVMILSDPEGTILDYEGDLAMRDPLERVRLVPGARWNESTIGTNAIGTALALGQPVQIHAAEHFCAGIQQWTCSAAVICDPVDSSVLGAIDVSGLSRSFTRHSLALVATTAERIESKLAQLEMARRFRLLELCMKRLSSSDGVLVFDRRGYLVKANEVAADALAAIGAQFRLSGTPRIPGLGDPALGERAVPEWIRPEWVAPVMDGAEYLGAAVHVPRRWSSAPLCPPPGRDVAPGFERIIGASAALHGALRKARQLARSQVTVLLLGETGVGKELFARGIHDAGGSSQGAFVALNCGGLSRELLASELFGYAEGAFTGAQKGGMVGKLEAAHGGTLFLDEIGEMPIDLQTYLLRVLEEGELYRIGETKPRKISFRLIAATNRDLRAEIANGKFRLDLFYRIAVTSIQIPPLRERPEDIRPIVEDLLATLCRKHELPLPTIAAGVWERLACYPWPGNVRELRNVIESALLVAEGDCLGAHDLPPDILDCSAKSSAGSGPRPGTLKNAEQERIRSAIRSSQGNSTLAAKKLDIAKSTLYRKLKKYDMQEILQEVRESA